MSMRKCDACHEVAWEDTMSRGFDEWYCKTCVTWRSTTSGADLSGRD